MTSSRTPEQRRSRTDQPRQGPKIVQLATGADRVLTMTQARLDKVIVARVNAERAKHEPAIAKAALVEQMEEALSSLVAQVRAVEAERDDLRAIVAALKPEEGTA
jgi:hypothetical protein